MFGWFCCSRRWKSWWCLVVRLCHTWNWSNGSSPTLHFLSHASIELAHILLLDPSYCLGLLWFSSSLVFEKGTTNEQAGTYARHSEYRILLLCNTTRRLPLTKTAHQHHPTTSIRVLRTGITTELDKIHVASLRRVGRRPVPGVTHAFQRCPPVAAAAALRRRRSID